MFECPHIFIYNSVAGNPYRRGVKGLSQELPFPVNIFLRDLSLKSGSFSLCNLNAVQGAYNLDVTLCKVFKEIQVCKGVRVI